MKFNREIRLGSKLINDQAAVYIIAEAGVNHGGDIEVAKELIDIAAEAGVDAIKFQAFRTKNLILEDVKKAGYQTKTTAAEESQSEMLKKLELRKEHYLELKEYCESKNVLFLITPFDEESLEELEELDVEAYKIASTDTTNIAFLERIAQKGKPMLLSTGMSFLQEVQQALETIYPINKNVILMQCTANYPLDDAEVNLNVLKTYAENFDILLGFSDHSVGVGAAPYSIPLGAKVIEKHYTLSKDLEGPDHKASLDPYELKEFVEIVRRVEKFMGTSEKKPTLSEVENRNSLQKCLVASQSIAKGEPFTKSNLVAKRTGGKGIRANEIEKIVGRKSDRFYKENQIITIE